MKDYDHSAQATSGATLDPAPVPSIRFRDTQGASVDHRYEPPIGAAESGLLDTPIPYLTQIGWLLSDASQADVLVVARDGRVLLANERGRAFASRSTAAERASLLSRDSSRAARFQTTPLTRIAGVPTSYLLVREIPTEDEVGVRTVSSATHRSDEGRTHHA